MSTSVKKLPPDNVVPDTDKLTKENQCFIMEEASSEGSSYNVILSKSYYVILSK